MKAISVQQYSDRNVVARASERVLLAQETRADLDSVRFVHEALHDYEIVSRNLREMSRLLLLLRAVFQEAVDAHILQI